MVSRSKTCATIYITSHTLFSILIIVETAFAHTLIILNLFILITLLDGLLNYNKYYEHNYLFPLHIFFLIIVKNVIIFLYITNYKLKKYLNLYIIIYMLISLKFFSMLYLNVLPLSSQYIYKTCIYYF